MALIRFERVNARRDAPIYGGNMRKVLLGAAAVTGLLVLTASGASAAQSNGSAVNHAALPHSLATDVYYHRWHHRRWHHWHRWHRRY
jgi:hypothetical protein